MRPRPHTPTQNLFQKLETRLDNVVSRLGLVPTRRMARQVVSHGHILVNNRRVTIPSYVVRPGDIVSVREGSKANGVFREDEAKPKLLETPTWLAWDDKKTKATVFIKFKHGTKVEQKLLTFDAINDKLNNILTCLKSTLFCHQSLA